MKITRAQLPADPISALKVLAYGTAAASKKPRKPADVAKRFKARKTAAKPRPGVAPGGHAQDGTT